jgi:hypothetical protein
MVRIIVLGFAAAGAALAVAFAQAPALWPAPAQAPGTDKNAETEPPSELDLLSRPGEDDPFPAFEDAAKRRPVSVTLRALDKITARYRDIETPIGEPVRFGSLEILPRFCDKRPPEEFPETTAFLEIFDRDLARVRAAAAAELAAGDEAEAELPEAPAPSPASASETGLPVESAEKPADPDRIFSGWMFASSPALNPLENAVYDVWVIDCKTEPVDN